MEQGKSYLWSKDFSIFTLDQFVEIPERISFMDIKLP